MRMNLRIGQTLILLMVLLAVLVPAGIAGEARTDAGGQWKYVQDGAGLVITGFTKGSFAELYALSNGIPYAYAADRRGEAELHYRRGMDLLGEDRHEEAELAFAKAAEMEPDNAMYLCDYGFTMAWFNHKFQEGYEALDRAVALEPSSGVYAADRGIILFLLGRADEAIPELRRAIEMDPAYANAFYYAAYALHEAGEYEEAVWHCKEYLARDPGRDYILVLMGDSLFMLGRYADALAAYDEAIACRTYYYAWNIENYSAAKLARMAERAAEVRTDGVEEITVSTAEELLNALGSDRRILVSEGVYNLTAAEAGFEGGESVYFRECQDGLQLIVDGVQNLTIRSAGDRQAELVASPRHANVLYFLNCLNIQIENVKAGHTEGGECAGGVFYFQSSAGIRVDGAALYGCGAMGICLFTAADAEVSGSTIYECSSEILAAVHSSNVLLTGCVFSDNRGPLTAYQTAGLTVDSCSFQRNAGRGALLDLSETENVTVKNTEFIGNAMPELVCLDESDIVFEDSNRYEGNAFDAGR